MNLSTIEMPRVEARRAFLEYREALKERHSDEDEAIMRGYRELSRGRQLIQLTETIEAGGTKSIDYRQWPGAPVRLATLPALAVMRADQIVCRVRTTTGGEVTYHPEGNPRANERRNVVRANTHLSLNYVSWTFRAMVPIVPPRFRPKHGLGNYHVLWEAEWEYNQPPRPPGDPALLKHIGGDLYVVLAIWDLTPLERAVLGQGRRP